MTDDGQLLYAAMRADGRVDDAELAWGEPDLWAIGQDTAAAVTAIQTALLTVPKEVPAP